jgi:tRNA (guanosine-2'-O-)-methyltransferase
MLNPTERLVFQHLGQFVSEHKKQGIEKILEHRTRYITVVLEDIFQSQNASAAIRTCECMGLQDIHIVENISKYSVNPKVLRGSNKWVDIHHYAAKKKHNTAQCIEKLKAEGYTLLITAPDTDGVSIYDIDVCAAKIALLFGNELRGVSQEAMRLADQKVRIPMYGFTESFNISVSVAICLSVIVARLHDENINWGLSDDEKDRLRLEWYRKIVRKSALIESEYMRTID